MRYAEKLEQLPVAGKAEEMRLIQVNKRTHHALDQVVQIFLLKDLGSSNLAYLPIPGSCKPRGGNSQMNDNDNDLGKVLEPNILSMSRKQQVMRWQRLKPN